MARATIELIQALRVTVERLRGDTSYQWGHMGECNCGHLAQTITKLGKADIHSWALQREGDWEQQAYDYCPTSGHRIDDVISAMLAVGVALDDIGHLEKLDDPEVLALVPPDADAADGRRHLRRNRREDVILYMSTWADLLERRLPAPAPSALPSAAA
ncbi:hypothetical protein [Haliangium sp.]|uniref:hypothetical protein n=1 Tax=Haliangium sp. TaxID=2663208 RepID=UPI003D152FE0